MAKRRRTASSRPDALRRSARLWIDLFREHDLLTLASAIALQAFVAAIALVLLALGVLGAIGRQDIWTTDVARQVQHRVLPDVFGGIDQTVGTIFAHDSTGLIVFASLLAVWEVSGSVRACMGALTRVYGAEESRPWWIRFPVSFGISVALIVALLGAIVLVLGVGNPAGALSLPVEIGRWLAAILLVGLAFGLLVRFAPAERRPVRWASGGTVLVVVAWFVESLLFSWYVSHVADFKTAAGSLLVLLVVTSYFYWAAIVLLVAIELDELLRKDANEIAGLVRGLVMARR